MTRHRWLILAALLGLAMCLTRHAAAGILLGSMIVFDHHRWLAAIPGLLAFGLWLAFAGTGAHHIAWHNPLPSLVGMAGDYWFVLGPLVVLGFWMLWHNVRLLAWAAIGWMAFIVVTLCFIDIAATDSRMMLPAVTLLMLGAFIASGKLNRAMVLATMAFLLIQSRATIASFPSSVDFNSSVWRTSATLAQLQKEGIPDSLVFSNAVDGVWFQTGKLTEPLPRTDGRPPQIPHPRMMNGLAYAIWFKTVGRNYYGQPKDYQNRVALNPDGNAAVYDMGDAIVERLKPVTP